MAKSVTGSPARKRAVKLSMRRFQRVPTVLGETERGEPILEVDSVRLVLLDGEHHFRYLGRCSRCQQESPGEVVPNTGQLRPADNVYCGACALAAVELAGSESRISDYGDRGPQGVVVEEDRTRAVAHLERSFASAHEELTDRLDDLVERSASGRNLGIALLQLTGEKVLTAVAGISTQVSALAREVALIQRRTAQIEAKVEALCRQAMIAPAASRPAAVRPADAHPAASGPAGRGGQAVPVARKAPVKGPATKGTTPEVARTKQAPARSAARTNGVVSTRTRRAAPPPG